MTKEKAIELTIQAQTAITLFELAGYENVKTNPVERSIQILHYAELKVAMSEAINARDRALSEL